MSGEQNTAAITVAPMLAVTGISELAVRIGADAIAKRILFALRSISVFSHAGSTTKNSSPP
jgi:hypothetical protein